MLATLDAQYEPPGRKYFSETAIPKLYNQLRGEITSELKEANFVALTTDMWSSINMSPYMSITAHYVSKDWTLKSKCLETAFAPESHTAAVLAEALQDGLQAWGVGEEKVACITSDNGANIVAAVRDLKWPWISCFGHNLNLAVNNALNKEKAKTERAFGVCRQINGAFSHSWQRRQQLRKEQEQQGIKKPLSLITDCATRWGSKYAMTERILALLPSIRRVFADDRSRRTLPTISWQDVSVLEAVKEGLKSVSEFTDIMSSERDVTISSLLPLLHLMKDTLKEKDTDVKLTADIKRTILEQLDNRYDNDKTIQLMRTASLLDPRYKARHMSAADLDYIRCQLEDEMVLFWKRDTPRPPVRVTDEEDAGTTQPTKKKKTLGSLLGTVKPAVVATPEQRAHAEMANYLQEEVADGETNALEWWRRNENRFPFMAKMAQKYLCIPATSTPSERIFSKAGNVVTRYRSLLKPDKVNMLVFLSNNL
ncbi:E3 SUMO-protein ligase ZBED1-like [Scomber scombrus]|uniref:E3 SUMO-protein ligase ZBED1-like n=1 Tax=Scomber scombrus TaxID=13677 RepID=UPI002DD845CC|nr:E3 SUMO-protein ligase ZBED1-like [Scomber scombrus]